MLLAYVFDFAFSRFERVILPWRLIKGSFIDRLPLYSEVVRKVFEAVSLLTTHWLTHVFVLIVRRIFLLGIERNIGRSIHAIESIVGYWISQVFYVDFSKLRVICDVNCARYWIISEGKHILSFREALMVNKCFY